MRCPNCSSECVEDDIHCRNCGANLVVTSTSLVPTRSNLPAVLHNSQLSRGVAAGVGALALGVGIELLRRGLVARLAQASARSAVPVASRLTDILLPSGEKPVNIKRKSYEIEETVVYMRRIIRH